MDEAVQKLWQRTQNEEFRRLLNMEVLEIEPGRALVAMDYRPELNNIFGRLHGGAVFSLLDEAFQLACNAHGSIAVAQQLSIYYLAPAEPGVRVLAEVTEMHATRKIALYRAEVRQADGRRLATATAQAYRLGRPLPFDDQGHLVDPA
ncbi:MAG: PaaI family thioesterase [Desulfarculus sp.]|nr:MAG: PaaI family thioesterase [Desulfarculus sp.]